jgi:hypothetical protein
MKNITKYLTTLSLLILLLPFLQTCTNQELKNPEYVGYEKNMKHISLNYNKEKSKKLKNESTFNGYRLAFSVFKNKLKKINIDDAILAEYFMLFSVLISIIICVFSFFNRFNFIVFYSTLANILLVILSIYVFKKSGVLRELYQIKVGYYLYAINLILIALFSRRRVSI